MQSRCKDLVRHHAFNKLLKGGTNSSKAYLLLRATKSDPPMPTSVVIATVCRNIASYQQSDDTAVVPTACTLKQADSTCTQPRRASHEQLRFDMQHNAVGNRVDIHEMPSYKSCSLRLLAEAEAVTCCSRCCAMHTCWPVSASLALPQYYGTPILRNLLLQQQGDTIHVVAARLITMLQLLLLAPFIKGKDICTT